MTRRLFSRQSGDGEYRVVFAQRGHKPRTEAFMNAITHEDQTLDAAHPSKRTRPSEVICGVPREHAGLQAVDYYLWALQRFYERGEPRFLGQIWPQTLEIIDLDASQSRRRDRTKSEFVIFNKEHPLNLESRTGVGNEDREI